MSREKAQTKIEEWFAGVTTPAFEAAVELKIAVGVAEGDYRFKDESERLAVRDGARRFFNEFARKVIELSDGRCVYFAPDIRAKARGVDNAMAWAEYAIHAVTSSGKPIPGKEVTVVVTRKKCPEITEPPPMPLAEVVKTVAQHQAAGFSPSTVT